MTRNIEQDVQDNEAPEIKPRKRRIKPDERYKEFLHEAVELFAEVGFDAGTRDLAQRLRVSQPLLYRYFPSKEDLITAVYNEIYVNRWKPAWADIITDETLPLRQRLQTFYEDYTDVIFTPEWLRIYLFAGLRGVDINRRYVINVEEMILKPIVRAVRRDLGADVDSPVLPRELEHFWTMQGGIFYYGVRHIIYKLEPQVSKSEMIADALQVFLNDAALAARG